MINIMITGAARSLGFALVKNAIARGDTVFAMVRQQADEVKFGKQDNLHVVEMDIASSMSVEHAFSEVDRILAGRKLDAVVNAAGVSTPGAIELTPTAEFEATLNTNALGSLRVMKASIPRLRGHGGRAIMITSLWGQASGAMLTAYCMSKHAIESLADCARRETTGMDMHVIVVEPGVIKTDMYLRQGPTVQALLDKMSPEQHALYHPIYNRYLNLVGGPGGKGLPGAGITAEQCAIDIEQAIFDPQPQTRYQSGDDAKGMVALAKQKSDVELDAILLEHLNNRPLDESIGSSAGSEASVYSPQSN
jgi:NAD(P)-dependent dehydrogenase (short-subunit alcohol dehydrogenase family)